jgi:uncharacterized alpha-E superfamily protein
MISRVADHCFWLGRYLERAEASARLLVVTLTMALDGELTERQCWLPVLVVSGEAPSFLARFGDEAAGDGERVQAYQVWDEQNFSSLQSSVAFARDNARSIREVVSLELWETVNELHLFLQSPEARELYDRERFAFYRHVRRELQLAWGFVHATMLHDGGLDFIRLGRLLEGVSQTARTLDVHHHAMTTAPADSAEPRRRHPVIETGLWLSVLKSLSAFEPFMKRARGQVTGRAVAEFLMFEERFPRSLRYGVRHARSRLAAIRPPENDKLPGRRSQERLAALDAWLASEAETYLGAAEQVDPHELLTHAVDETAAICELLGRELLGAAPLPETASASTPAPATAPGQ